MAAAQFVFPSLDIYVKVVSLKPRSIALWLYDTMYL